MFTRNEPVEKDFPLKMLLYKKQQKRLHIKPKPNLFTTIPPFKH